MRVVVLGAGLLGVTSAYYLQQLGHEVTVVDRHAMPAAKARGRVASPSPSPSPLDPLARRSPAAPGRSGRSAGRWTRLCRRVGQRLASLVDHAIGKPPKRDPLDHLVRMAAYSRKSVRALRDEAGLPQNQNPRTAGLLNLFTDAEAFHLRMTRSPHWLQLGCEDRLLSADEAVQLEPALQAVRSQLAGAAFAVEDPARDPAPFAASLVFLCRAAGVRFLTKHTVVGLNERQGRIDHVDLLDAAGQAVQLSGQAYVLALGASSVPHAQSLGIDMPLRFVREYIAKIPVRDPGRAPRLALRDRQGKLRITRVETPGGDHLRVLHTVRAGAEEEAEPDSDRFQAMLRRVELLLPGAGDLRRASLEVETNAVSRNRLPMIGKTRLPNLFLNTAPGTPDWSHVCGAGKSIARIVSGLRPELNFAFRQP